jgi:AraC-like DNA-binding protein
MRYNLAGGRMTTVSRYRSPSPAPELDAVRFFEVWIDHNIHIFQCRIFKLATGLLKETDWPMTRVAAETGFDSIAHFGRVFKGITGRAPLQYRKQHRE